MSIKTFASISRMTAIKLIGAVMVIAALFAGAVVGGVSAPQTPANAVVVPDAPEGVLGGGVSVGGSGGSVGHNLSVSSVGGSGGVTGR